MLLSNRALRPFLRAHQEFIYLLLLAVCQLSRDVDES